MRRLSRLLDWMRIESYGLAPSRSWQEMASRGDSPPRQGLGDGVVHLIAVPNQDPLFSEFLLAASAQ